MRIEAGKIYRNRDGQKIGPMQDFDPDKGNFIVKAGDGDVWSREGNYHVVNNVTIEGRDLIAEWTDEPEWPQAGDEVTFGGYATSTVVFRFEHQGEDWITVHPTGRGTPYTVRVISVSKPKPEYAWIEHDGKNWPKCGPDAMVEYEDDLGTSMAIAGLLRWNVVRRYRVTLPAETHD